MNVNVWPDLFRQVLSVSTDKCLMEHTYSAKHEIAGCMRLCSVDYIIIIHFWVSKPGYPMGTANCNNDVWNY